MEINITTLPTFSLDLLKIQRVNIRSIISTSWRPHNEDSSTDTVFIKTNMQRNLSLGGWIKDITVRKCTI